MYCSIILITEKNEEKRRHVGMNVSIFSLKKNLKKSKTKENIYMIIYKYTKYIIIIKFNNQI